ncbi:MAG: D-alanyl-D-alanine carboxypeptidase [Bacilli bacterium]|nr:D-alanyl-D-alanine carboxypeptidase [Bacilli bacterium]
MKKIILIFILLFPLNVNAISASAYIVMDSDNNRVLEGSNINTPYLIASITKIMTAIVVLNNADIKKEITINDEVLKSYGSGIYIEVGEKILIKNLLYGLILRSGNDAAIALAHEVGGSMEGFVLLMNETAKLIGMNNTTFLNNHGLEENNKNGNTSTVYDMGLLSSYAINNPQYKKITSTKKMIVKTNYKTYVWHNKNKLLNSYEYCIGGKTGFTELARRTLVTNASKDNMNLTIVTFKDGNDFQDHRDLYEKAFKNYKNYKILKKGYIDTKINNTYLENDINITLTNKEYKKIEINYIYNKKNVTNIAGEIQVKLNNKIIKKENIYLKEKNNSPKLNFIQKILKKFGIYG